MFDLEEEFDKSWQEESRKHAAITIRNEVEDWCQSSKRSIAEKRWLWELFQNAIDTAKSHSVQELNISLELKDGNLLVKHNGGSFQLKEIIALVSGGTSKYFGRETIGRFGKGFLVTHILSKKVIVEGLVTHAEETRPFRIELDRSGDESAIEKNINDCKKQLSQTSKDTAIPTQTETTFTYIGADEKTIGLCRNLEHVLPYVMAFNPIIEKVNINLGKEDFQGEWIAEKSKECLFGEHIIDQQTIVSSSTGNVMCLKTSLDGLEIAIQSKDLGGQVEVVDTRLTPCFYSTLPLCDSDAITASYAVNSRNFNIDTDRSFMNSTPENSKLLGMLPESLAVLLDYLAGIGAHGLHRLAYLDISKLPEDRKDFLREVFRLVFEIMSSRQIVGCKNKNVTPSSAHIPAGDYLGQHVPNLVSHTNWLVAQQYPDVPELFEEWEQIAKEWAALNVNLQTHSLESLIENSTVASQSFDLNTKKNYAISLVRALVFAQQATKSIPEGITEKRILINQKAELVAPQDANIDSSVDEKLKSIASAAGWDIKNQLLDADQLQDDAMKAFIDHTLCSGRETFTNDLVLKRIWQTYISTKWEENQKDPSHRKALLELAIWLILNKRDELRTILDPDSLPVLCDDDVFRCSEKMQSYPFIWPREKWSDNCQQYGSLINSRWIISGEYLRMLTDDQQKPFLEGLAALPVAFQEPVFSWTEKQLSEKEAETLVCLGEFPNGAKVSCYDLTGLQDMTSAVAGTKDLGKASRIVEFILNYVINSDDSWESPVNLGEKTLFPCYWLAVLKTKDWVPSADGRHLEPLNRENLERLLLGIPNFQLTKRIVDFLAKHFDISLSGVLALKLKTMNPSDSRISLVDRLVALPADYAEKIADEVEDRLAIIQRVRRNQKIGRIIEEIVKKIFEREGFKTEWTGIGSDFKLVESDDIGLILLNQGTGKTAGQEILIEVKAASTEMVRMTLEQSRRAVQQKAHFILCVADVSPTDFQLDDEEVINDALVEEISHSLRFVPNISQSIETAVKEAEELHLHQIDLRDVEISPGVKIGFEESQIRIGVMKEIWGKGNAIEEILLYCKNTFGDT